ncbi:hypothetical protein Tco_0956194 [Tanacetum coccineum]|uniref:Uncharacterized protein n=1 Tax=Tanacetum coccineum TaxID=301880 RepID=A0ABQ5E9A1_9ASTR
MSRKRVVDPLCGDGSAGTTFQAIASLIAKGKIGNKSKPRSFPVVTVKVKELNGIPVALMARFGVVSKSTDRIMVSHGG